SDLSFACNSLNLVVQPKYCGPLICLAFNNPLTHCRLPKPYRFDADALANCSLTADESISTGSKCVWQLAQYCANSRGPCVCESLRISSRAPAGGIPFGLLASSTARSASVLACFTALRKSADFRNASYCLKRVS